MFVAKCVHQKVTGCIPITAAIKKTTTNLHHTADIKKTSPTYVAGRRIIQEDTRSITAYVAKNILYPNDVTKK